MAAMKIRFPCHKYNKFGHWENDQNPDGTLRQGVKCFETPENSSSSHTSTNNNNGMMQVILGFNSKVISTSDTIKCSTAILKVSDYNIGPLVDEVAAYSAIGEHELKLFQTLNPSEGYEYESKPLEPH